MRFLSVVNEHQQPVWNWHTQQSHDNRGGYAAGKTSVGKARVYWEMRVGGTSVVVENHQSWSWQHVGLITFGVTYKNCHKRAQCYDSLVVLYWEFRVCYSHADFLVRKLAMLYSHTYIQIKIHRYIKPNFTVDGTGYKWKFAACKIAIAEGLLYMAL